MTTTRLHFGCGAGQTIIINDDACLAENEWQVTIQYCDFVIYIPKATVVGNSLVGDATCVFAPNGEVHKEHIDVSKTLAEQGYLMAALTLKEDIIPHLRKQ